MRTSRGGISSPGTVGLQLYLTLLWLARPRPTLPRSHVPSLPRSPQRGGGIVSRQAVLAVEPAGTARGELLRQVENWIGQPLLQCFRVLLGIVLTQTPVEMLVVVYGLVQLLHWGPCEGRAAGVLELRTIRDTATKLARLGQGSCERHGFGSGWGKHGSLRTKSYSSLWVLRFPQLPLLHSPNHGVCQSRSSLCPSPLTFECNINSFQADMETNVSADSCCTEGLVGCVGVHPTH